ncbi:MAG: GFA family protein [Proteobacteria bacterium]|nr:GFA family protein [Pseudomonadota bacterium]
MTEFKSGGCQCGAIRFRASKFGRASLCHCRMCQKAFGGIGGALVTAHDLEWTRGAPAYFQSSERVRRGFCQSCGTPLTFEPEGGGIDIAIAAFDKPDDLAPVIQLDRAHRIAWADALASLPEPSPDEQAKKDAWYAEIRSHQHPDHDTHVWPPAKDKP